MKAFWENTKKFILSKLHSKYWGFQTAIYLLFLILLIIIFQIKFNKNISVKIDSKTSQTELDELFEKNNQELSVLQKNQIKTETEKTKVTPDNKSKTLVEKHKATTVLGEAEVSKTFVRDLSWWKEFIVNYYKTNNLKLSTESFKKLFKAKSQKDLNKFMDGEILKYHPDKGGNNESSQNIIALRKYLKESYDQQNSIGNLENKDTLTITPEALVPQKSLKVDDIKIEIDTPNKQIEIDTPNKQIDITTPQASVNANSIVEEASEIDLSEKDINTDQVSSTSAINTSYAKSKIESKLETCLINAEHSGDANLLETIVDKILEKDSDLNALLKNGDTVLIMCVRWDLIDMVEKLLQKGANPNIENQYGQTALMFAARYGRTAIGEKLLQQGANPNVKDRSGETSLMKGVIWSHPKIVEKLLEQGANPNAEDQSGKTPLIRAVSNGYTAIVEKLLEQGANPNLKDKDGQTALSIAIKSIPCNDAIVIKLLTSKKTPEALNELVNILSDKEKAKIAKPISEAMNLLSNKKSTLNDANNHKTLNEIDYFTEENIQDKLKGKELEIEEISNAKLERLLKLYPVVALYNIGDEKKQAVFKPVRFDDAKLISVKDVIAELVAYKISQQIGFPNIPITKVVKIDGKIGSLQDFVAGDIDRISKEKLVKNKIHSVNFKNKLDKLKIFSFVFAQWDLCTDNMIVNYDNGEYSLSAIDNGNIWNPQKIQKYGQRLFVEHFNLPKHNASEGEFPFGSAQTLNEEQINKIIQFSETPENLKKILEKMNGNKYVKKLYVIYQKKLWIYYPYLIKPYVENFDKAIVKDIVVKLKAMQKDNQIKEIVGGIVTKSLLDQFPISEYEKQDVFNTFNVEYVNTVNERLEMVLRGLTKEIEPILD